MKYTHYNDNRSIGASYVYIPATTPIGGGTDNQLVIKLALAKSVVFLIFFACCLIWGREAWGQQTLTINGSEGSEYVPISGLYVDQANLKSEFIIPSSDLTPMNGKNITKMCFFQWNDAWDPWNVTVDVFLKEVNQTTFSSAFLGQTGATTVYHGVLNANNSNDPMYVVFDNEFTYHGGNLLVGFYVTNSGTSYSCKFFGKTTSSFTAAWGYNSFNRIKFIPKVKFTYTSDNSCEEVVVGTESSTNTYVPLYGAYNKNYEQMIYTANDMGNTAGIINKIAFKSSKSDFKSRTLKIYMGTTTKTNFESNTDFVALDNLEEVYSGTLEIEPGWNVFDLQLPFNYDGHSNLIVAMYNTVTSTATTSSSFYYTSTTDDMTISAFHNTYDPSPSTTNWSSYSGNKYLRKTRPNIKFCMTNSDVESCVQIGNATNTTGYAPINLYSSPYNHSYTQQLYTAEEILAGGVACKVEKLKFQYSGGIYTVTVPIVVYLGQTSSSSLASSWISETSPENILTEVYRGSVTFNSTGWYELDVSSANYMWDGTSNILVAVKTTEKPNATGTFRYTSTASGDYKARYAATTDNSPIALNGNNVPTSATGTQSLQRPNITFCVTPFSCTPLSVDHLDVSQPNNDDFIDGRKLQVTWDEVEGVTYKLYYGVNDPSVDIDALWEVPNSIETDPVHSPYVATHLTNGKPYYFAIKPVGSGNYCSDNDPVVFPQTVTPVCRK